MSSSKESRERAGEEALIRTFTKKKLIQELEDWIYSYKTQIARYERPDIITKGAFMVLDDLEKMLKSL